MFQILIINVLKQIRTSIYVMYDIISGELFKLGIWNLVPQWTHIIKRSINLI
jgi:hypothetical protein